MAAEVAQALTVMRRRQLQERINLSRSSIYDRLNPKSPLYDPTFPKPVRLGKRAIGFVEAEVVRWLEQRIAERETL